MEHRASCQCGQFSLTATAEPDFVVACNCVQCQRRTGAPFGVGVYFKKSDLTLEGDFRQWARRAPTGRQLSNHFCPDCGTNLCWSLEMRPEHMGVALGCLSTTIAEPSRAIWLSEKHDWVRFPDHWPQFDGPTPEGGAKPTTS